MTINDLRRAAPHKPLINNDLGKKRFIGILFDFPGYLGYISCMIRIQDIRDTITQAQSDYVMGIVNQAVPSIDDHVGDIIGIVDDLVCEENCTASGYDFKTGVRDMIFEDDDFILEVELPTR